MSEMMETVDNVRVVNEKHETITEYDLTHGSLIAAKAVREDAAPIDNVTKYAWSEEDYEDVQMYVRNWVGEATAPLSAMEKLRLLAETIEEEQLPQTSPKEGFRYQRVYNMDTKKISWKQVEDTRKK